MNDEAYKNNNLIFVYYLKINITNIQNKNQYMNFKAT